MNFYDLEKRNFSSTNQSTDTFSSDMNLQEHLEATITNSAVNKIINNQLLHNIACAYLQGNTHIVFMYDEFIPKNYKEAVIQKLIKMGFSCIELKGKFLKNTPIALKVSLDKENANAISIIEETIVKYGASKAILNELYELSVDNLEKAAEDGKKSTTFYISNYKLPSVCCLEILATQLENHLRKKGLNSQVIMKLADNGCKVKISW